MYKTESGREITYYGRENAKSCKRFNNSNNIINTLDDLFEALLKAWCKETAYPSCQEGYDHFDDPTYGQCAITAMIVNDLFGGTIHKVKVDGGGTHYFNKINDSYIDLTSDQFTLYELYVDYESNVVVPREYCGKNADTKKRYDLLASKLNKEIGE